MEMNRRKEIIPRTEKQLTEKEKYKKRLIIESFFSWIKNYPSINQKTIASYNGLLMLASSILISKRITNDY